MNNYPKFAKIDNKQYRINTDYKVALKCIDVAESTNVTDEERGLAIIFLLFGEKGLNDANNWERLLKVALKYLRCNQEETDGNIEEKNMDFKQDWGYIRTSFFYDYKIDLDVTSLHWWSFYEKTCGLSEKCILNRIRFLRDFDVSQIKDITEKEKWIKQKQQVALKEEKTAEEKRLDELFKKQMKGE